jgi:hypothetical protein
MKAGPAGGSLVSAPCSWLVHPGPGVKPSWCQAGPGVKPSLTYVQVAVGRDVGQQGDAGGGEQGEEQQGELLQQ